MNQEELLPDLPSEIIINILSRLPVRTIISCKCVCKSWLHLLNSPEFVQFHLSRSKPVLVVYVSVEQPYLFSLLKIDDPLHLENHHFSLRRTARVSLRGSANGLLFLHAAANSDHNALYICNPITRDYIELPTPEFNFSLFPSSTINHGFGFSKMSRQHKVVRIFHDRIYDPSNFYKLLGTRKFVCHVYTLGTGSWRSIAPGATLDYNDRYFGALFNGNLHWLTEELNGPYWISCFDLETETFSTFSPPPDLHHRSETFLRGLVGLVAFGDCLCLYDNSSDDEIIIWLMNEYGVERSWTKEFVIKKINLSSSVAEAVIPIKVFKDGDILTAWEDVFVYYYSNKTKIISRVNMFDLPFRGYTAMLHAPSFLSLKNSFPMENVKSF